MDKQQEMVQLKAEARVVRAETCAPDVVMVWGEGDLNAKLVIVGEAPGAQEDKEGRPFVGPAGKLLNQELENAGIPRDTVYITNVVKCRPVVVQNGRIKNRTPNAKEIKAWTDILFREIDVISPNAILCFGAVAASALIHPKFGMNAEHGNWFTSPLGISITATFHPAYLLRVMSFDGAKYMDMFREDLRKVAEMV